MDICSITINRHAVGLPTALVAGRSRVLPVCCKRSCLSSKIHARSSNCSYTGPGRDMTRDGYSIRPCPPQTHMPETRTMQSARPPHGDHAGARAARHAARRASHRRSRRTRRCPVRAAPLSPRRSRRAPPRNLLPVPDGPVGRVISNRYLSTRREELPLPARRRLWPLARGAGQWQDRGREWRDACARWAPPAETHSGRREGTRRD
jgi:hypothetical protein